MNVTIVRPGALPGERVDVCIVIDVLRATTTASVLCQRLGELCVVRAPSDLGLLPARSGGYVLFSELSGVVTDLERFDNSPVLARDVALGERTPVLVTTNGTLAVGQAVELARHVVLASFVNLSAVAAHVTAAGARSVAVMPAGNINKGGRCIEDDSCADALAARLTGTSFDIAAAVAACHADARIQRRRANEPGLGADIDLCLALDAIAVVPRIVGDAAQPWFRVVQAGQNVSGTFL